MSYSSQLATKLQDLQNAALDQAESLAQALQSISDLYWQDSDNEPLFRATEDTMEVLKSIKLKLAMPMGEIEAAR